jgi:hypothetical protein
MEPTFRVCYVARLQRAVSGWGLPWGCAAGATPGWYVVRFQRAILSFAAGIWQTAPNLRLPAEWKRLPAAFEYALPACSAYNFVVCSRNLANGAKPASSGRIEAASSRFRVRLARLFSVQFCRLQQEFGKRRQTCVFRQSGSGFQPLSSTPCPPARCLHPVTSVFRECRYQWETGYPFFLVCCFSSRTDQTDQKTLPLSRPVVDPAPVFPSRRAGKSLERLLLYSCCCTEPVAGRYFSVRARREANAAR